MIADYDDPVFFSDGLYWHNDGGYWYSSRVYNGGWARVDRPPERFRTINTRTYVHYRPAGYVPRASRPERNATVHENVNIHETVHTPPAPHETVNVHENVNIHETVHTNNPPPPAHNNAGTSKQATTPAAPINKASTSSTPPKKEEVARRSVVEPVAQSGHGSNGRRIRSWGCGGLGRSRHPRLRARVARPLGRFCARDQEIA